MFLHYQADYGILSGSGSMFPEYGLCMSLVRSTSVALYICEFHSKSFSGQSKSDSDEPASQDGRQYLISARWRFIVNGIVDILCYVWYLPLFFSGPLMTYENFHRQVSMRAV